MKTKKCIPTLPSISCSCLGFHVFPVNPLPQLTDLHWKPATATWYGSPEGDGSDGGACGYGPLVDVKPLKARVGAASPILFKNGEGCGACYKVKCLEKSICSRRAVTVIITDECPGGYCSSGRTHFDLSGAAFGRMAVSGNSGQLRNRGEISVIFRRTPCKYPGKNVAFHVNEGSTEYWLSLLVEYEDGDGDIGSMHIKPVFISPFLDCLNFQACNKSSYGKKKHHRNELELIRSRTRSILCVPKCIYFLKFRSHVNSELLASSTEWLEMKHLWGANWCIIGGPLQGPFSVKLTTLSTSRSLSARGVIPRNWSPKATYTSRLNFYK
ncbi:hypothetical protein IFM89_025049 [Coptis chinensis]|uniref:Uncharacterized protein n=1 Tax=Coptis chinensis TaxID=261450 RepID=A0A835H0F5_9MAGN|nr:hypothetical protein IFM89_025049 [Coptis chinensis]